MWMRFKAGEVVIEAQLNNSRTAKFLWDRLPVQGEVELYGDEVYFYLAACTGPEEKFTAPVVELGAVAYSPQGPCLCLFFGSTPASREGECRPASMVTVIGKIIGDPERLRHVKLGDKIEVTRA